MTVRKGTRLASKEPCAKAETAEEQYLLFVVSGSSLAVALRHVAEIVPYEHVTRVPGTPGYVRGVVHLRGRVVPVIDLAEKLGMVVERSVKRSSIVMLDRELDGVRFPMGVVVDGVATLLDVQRKLIQPAPHFGAGVFVSHLEGLFQAEGRSIPLLDVNRLFAVQELKSVLRASEARQEVELDQLAAPDSHPSQE